MLEAARVEREDQRRDVVVGIVETHGRYDTGALLIGLELLPRRKVEHRGVQLEELDLDAALARRPGLILVDELAHTNAPGSRHAKRWQDVEELLDAGIDVFTTLNVQHLESLNDVVAQITGVIVRETVPDAVFDRRRRSAPRSTCPSTSSSSACARARSTSPSRPRRAARTSSARATSSRSASSRCAARPSGSTRRCAATRTEHGIDRTWHTRPSASSCA